MNITIEIKAPELAHAIAALASALSGNKLLNPSFVPFGESDSQSEEPTSPPVQQAPIQQAPIQQTPIQQPQYQAPVQQQAPTQQQPQYQPPLQQVPMQAPIQQAPMQQQPMQQQPIPQQPIQQAPQAVPTSAPGYTMDQLAVAATQLVDAGRRAELLQMLSTFGVPALTSLPKEQYGAFATKLREMGAKI